MSAMSELADDAGTAALLQRLEQLTSFNHHVAHDLRVPVVLLAAAAQRAQQALQQGDAAEAARMLHILCGRAEHLERLLRALMTLAHADAPLAMAPVDLNAVLGDALADLQGAPLPPTAALLCLHPLPVVRGAAPLLRQVYVNLVGNALKFAQHQPQPRVEIGCDGHALYVRDNGVGFDAAQALRLFQPFTRLHAGAFAGHGIGLALVRRVVERHGGRVWAEPAAGGGAVFRFTLGAAP
jgi:signal transduction histidine kinase